MDAYVMYVHMCIHAYLHAHLFSFLSDMTCLLQIPRYICNRTGEF